MIILDANALVKLIIREENSSAAVSKVERAIAQGETVALPETALAEALNAIWKHVLMIKDVSKTEAIDYVEKLLFVWHRMAIIEIEPLAMQAIALALENRIAVYDALYIAASKSNDAPLLTFDGEITKKSIQLGLKLL